MSEEGNRERFAREVETRNCLIKQGYEISEPPSEQAWLEQINAGADGVWLPYWEVLNTGITKTEEAALKEICPDPADRFY